MAVMSSASILKMVAVTGNAPMRTSRRSSNQSSMSSALLKSITSLCFIQWSLFAQASLHGVGHKAFRKPEGEAHLRVRKHPEVVLIRHVYHSGLSREQFHGFVFPPNEAVLNLL